MTKLTPFRAAAQAAALLCGCLLAWALASAFAWADPASAFTPAHSKPGTGENTPLTTGTTTTATHTSSGGASIVRTIVGLAIVIGVIWGLAWILRQVKSGRDPRVSATGLTSVAALTLGSGRSVHLVKAGNDYILLGAAEQGLAPIHRYTEQQAYEAGLLFDEEPGARPRRRLLLPASTGTPTAADTPVSPGAVASSGAPSAAQVPRRLESGERPTDPMRMPSTAAALVERLRELTVRR